jgi:hypothetical protein
VAVHPEDPDIIFVGGGPENGNGMWRSIDRGATWSQINTGLGALHRVSAVAVQPTSTRTTDDAREIAGSKISSTIMIGAMSLSGPAVYRSTDLGDHWSGITSGVPVAGGEVTAIVFDPSSPDTAYAALNDSQGGVVKSIDGGLTWSDSSTGLADGFCGAGCVLDLAIDPSDTTVLYAAMPVLLAVYKTTNAGDLWSPTGAGIQPQELILDPLHPSTLFASGSVPGQGGIEKTINGGTVWTELSDQPGLPDSEETSHRTMVLDPHRPDTVWLMVEDVWAPNPLEAAYRSADGGLSWTMTDTGLEGVRVGDFAYCDGWVLAATDDGVYRIFDGLFRDGFENGDLLAWSTHQGGSRTARRRSDHNR